MTAQTAKIAVYGAGAMGTVLGALLTKGGLKNVHLISRNLSHVNGLNTHGAQIDCVADGITLNVPVTARTPEQMDEKYDVVFLMTKQRDNKDILHSLLPKLKDGSVVCTTQNGLPELSVAEIVGNERTYGCVCSYGANRIGGGRVEMTSSLSAMRVQVGGYQNDGKTAALLHEILSYAGKAIDNENFANSTENLAGARWSKLAINAAFSGLSVVTGLTFGEIATRRKTKKLALGILRECMDVASATGVVLEPMQGKDMQKLLGGRGFFQTQFALFALPFAMKRHKKLKSGMLKDVLDGKRCEIDFLNGIVCKIGASVSVETPLCQTIVELTHDIENGLCEITPKNVDFF